MFNGATVEAGASTEIFAPPRDAVVVGRDGQRFLADTTAKLPRR